MHYRSEYSTKPIAMRTSRLKPVAKQPAEQQAAEHLRESILSGALKPGSRLTEEALAEQLGVARGTLRTGLNRLAMEGLIVLKPYVGWEVATLTADDIWEIWTLRGSLESLGASLVAKAQKLEVLKAIEETFNALAKACENNQRKRIDELDFQLHRLIIDSANNSRLSSHYKLVEQQVRWVITSTNVALHESTDTILEQHRALVEAILAGDSQGASQAAWRHAEYDGARLVDWARGEFALPLVKKARGRKH